MSKENELFNESININYDTNNNITTKFKKRFRVYNPYQLSFTNFNPDKCFPIESFERFLVDSLIKLDISVFEDKTGNDLGGRDEQNPKSMLGIILYGFSNGTYSARKQAESCIHDLRYQFISGHEAPDHSTISRFINKYESAICDVFVKILYVANDLGFIDYDIIATDGSKFRANASKKFTGTLEDFRKRVEKIKEKIKLAIERQKETDKKEEIDYWKNKQKRYEKEKVKIENFLDSADEVYTKENKEVKQNITDNDSRILRSSQGYIVGYNAQISSCSKNGLIVANSVINNSNDNTIFKGMIEEIEKKCPENKKEKLKEAAYLNDAGYYSIDNIIYSKENKINAYIPDSQDKNIYSNKKKDKDLNKVTSKECNIKIIDGKKQLFCPGDLVLEFKKQIKDHGISCYSFGIKNEDKKKCETCTYYQKCINKDKEKKFTVRKKLFDNYEFVESMKEKMRTNSGRIIYSKRMPTIEKIFGHIKENMKFRSFTLRGLSKIKTQWAIVCSTYNLKRIFNLKCNLI